MTRSNQKLPTTTIQTWPGGTSYEYRGDPFGAKHARSIRTREVACDTCRVRAAVLHCGHELRTIQTWRKGTPDEWRTIQIAIRAAMYAAREVLACQSGLVDDLIKLYYGAGGRSDLAEAFGSEEIRNLYADPAEWDAAQCREWLDDHDGSHVTDCLEDDPDACLGAASDCPSHGLSDVVTEHLREAVRDRASDHPQEPLEWWLVSSWLCDQLHAIGEVTIDNGYGRWWGRTCSGQGFLMDGTLQQIAAKYVGEGE